MFQFTGFTEKADGVLNRAVSFAEGAGHTYIGTEHLLWALSAPAAGVAGAVLSARGITPDAVEGRILSAVGSGVPTALTRQDFTPRLGSVLAEALRLAQKEELGAGTGHLLSALLGEKHCAALQILSESGVSGALLLQDLQSGLRGAEQLFASVGEKKRTGDALEKYAVELTGLVRGGKLDPVVCRDAEIARVIRILCRRTKNNPCLIGDPGVGKTAVVEGLAARIAAGEVPEPLQGKKLWSLELNSMVAGAKYRGDFEERIKNVLRQASAAGDAILFIDELHNIIGAGAAEGAVDAANILKPALARGELRLIGATTVEEYRKYIEKDAALERRFQTVSVEEPTPARAEEILRTLRPKYEAFHGCEITDDAVNAAVSLSARYLPDRFLPDKAIDLMDEAAAQKNVCRGVPAEAPEKSLAEARRLLRLAARTGDAAAAGEALVRQAQSLNALQNGSAAPRAENAFKNGVVTAEDIAAVLSEQTGIPAEELRQEEKTRLAGLEAALSQYVIGQPAAVRAVASAIRRSRTGLADPDRPMGSFFFCGPTGVGKTELAKAVAACVFQDEKALIRVDMSEFSQPHAVARLFGAPPGYVGFEQGGQLTEKLRRRPYSVLLFDETEKAHPEVFNALLQILEDGVITSAAGKPVSCRNCIVILTSNVGDRFVSQSLPSLGFAGANGPEGAAAAVREELKKTFRPEFLNRIDEIVVFERLGEDSLCAIAEKMLSSLADRAAAFGLELRFTPSLAPLIVRQCGAGPYGARPLRRFITTRIADPLSDLLLADGLPAGGVTVAAENGNIEFIL